ncbi:MAG: hypothetical protein ACUVUD_06215 [bacterium]
MMLLLIFIFSLSGKNEVGLSGDYFSQRYTITDTVTRDTSALDTELRLVWDFRLEPISDSNGFATAKRFDGGVTNALAVSTRSIRERIGLSGTWVLSPQWRLGTGYDGELRYYHPGFLIVGDTQYSCSYLNNNLTAGMEFFLASGLTLNINEGLEIHRYLPEESGNANYFLNRIQLGAKLAPPDGVSFSLAYGYNWFFVPKVESNGYGEHAVTGSGEVYFDTGGRLVLQNYFIRRRYLERMRSYWDEHPMFTFSWDAGANWAFTLEEDLRLTGYDETTAVYQNLIENRVEVEGEWRIGENFVFRFGPQLEISRNRLRTDEQDYHEVSFSVGGEVFSSSGFWVSIEDRLGKRRYPAADSWFLSDYRFNEFNFLLNWQLLNTRTGGLTGEALVSFAPEWHTETIDNLAALSYSFGLKFRF